MDSRLEKMMEMEHKGLSRAAIGKCFNISRERVRQIMGNFSPKEKKICLCCGDKFLPKVPASKCCSEKCNYVFRQYGGPAPNYNDRRIADMMKNISPPNTKGCWEWRGSGNPITGYGRFGWKSKGNTVHRVMWQLVYGDIPEGMFVLHKCDNPPCCNPYHLFLGTAGDNAKDRDAKGRHQWGVLDKKARATIKLFYNSASDAAWLGESFGVHPGTIYKTAMGKTRNDRPPGGFNPKLTSLQVHRIRDLYSYGCHTYSSLAMMYSIGREAVRRIIKRKTWKHI